MERPLDLTAHHVELDDATRTTIDRWVERLERVYPRLVGCSVKVEGPGQHHATGGPYSVHVELRVPGDDPIAVSHKQADSLDTAVRQSFEAARRRLEDFARKRREAERRVI